MKQSNKVFGFQDQLKIGNKGENSFVKYYKDRGAKKVKTRDFDITIDNDKKVELKTDSYKMEKTANFFFERYRNAEKAPGGPWQSKEKGCHYFVYDKTFFWFDNDKLCKFLDKIIKNYEPKQIRNKGWACIGYAIPREIVKHLVIQEDKF